jgi:RNA polymerase sigma-70 factor, ECF subfamily
MNRIAFLLEGQTAMHHPGMAPVPIVAAANAEVDAGDDLDLTARVARSDADAKRELALRLIRSVTRTVRTLLRGDAEADDAVQLSMMEILRSASTYRGEASLERWAGRITVRTTLHFVRQRRARGELIEPDSEQAESAGGEGVHTNGVTASSLDALLAPLSDARRTCVVLRHVFEYTVEEIAELTGVSPNTVKDRLLQARNELRERVRRDEEVVESWATRQRRRRVR